MTYPPLEIRENHSTGTRLMDLIPSNRTIARLGSFSIFITSLCFYYAYSKGVELDFKYIFLSYACTCCYITFCYRWPAAA
jgi:hypothetical protein